jgi:hypothetical protein
MDAKLIKQREAPRKKKKLINLKYAQKHTLPFFITGS